MSENATIGAAGTLTIGGPVSLAANNVSITGNGNIVVLGTVTGAGSINKNGSGTLTLAGTINSTGGTNINQGLVKVLTDESLGAAGSGYQTVVNSGATLELVSNVGINSDNILLIAGSGVAQAGVLHATFSDNSLSGMISMMGSASVNINSGSSLALGAIGELDLGLDLTKNGPGILRLLGANTYTGTLIVNQGTVSINSDNRFGGLSGLSLAAGTTLDLNDFSESLGDLSGVGTISYGPIGGGVLTVGAKGTNTTFSGSIIGTGDFVKTGAGTFTLGVSNLIPATSSVSIEGGTLNIGATTQSTGRSLSVAHFPERPAALPPRPLN